MPTVYGPWQTRSIDVDALTLYGQVVGGNLREVVNCGIIRASSGAAIGASPPGSFPWRDDSLRLAAANAARNNPFFSGGSAFDAQVFGPVYGDPPPGWNPGTIGGRRLEVTARAGVSSFTTADRQLFGTYYDDWTFGMDLGRATWSIEPSWLAGLIMRPSTTSFFQPLAPLTPEEYDDLWDYAPPTSAFFIREVDVYNCSASLATTWQFGTTSSTSPTLTRHLADSSHYAAAWYLADQIEALPVVGSISPGAGPTVNGAFGSGDVAPKIGGSGGSPLPAGATLYDFQLDSLWAPWILDGAPGANLTDQTFGRIEYVDYPPQWPTSVTPPYDETGGIPPLDPPSHIYVGGDAASRWAQVRMKVTTTFTVRYRWVGFVSGVVPPLHQRGRLGVMDAPTQVVSGRMSPQSSSIQSGML